MKHEPEPGERYQDDLTKNVFEVIHLAVEAETGKRLVVYRLRGGETWFTLPLDSWEQLLGANALAFVGRSEPPSDHRSTPG